MLAMLLLVTMTVLWAPSVQADVPPSSGFPNTGSYTARMVQSQGNVAVVEINGDYSRGKTEPRTVIAKEFYKNFADDYDFIVTFSTFEFETGDATAFCMPVRNDVKGIGMALFDNASAFGSKGKLQAYIDMAALTRYVLQPSDARFENVLHVLAHEMLHRWAAHVSFIDAQGQPNRSMIGKDDAHWSFLLDTGGSVEYGNRWQDNGDGTFTSVPGRQFFSPMDLYLMGVFKKQEVPPFFYIDSQDIPASDLPRTGVTVRGIRRDVSIDQVVAAEGERQPDADGAQKQFRMGFVLLTRPGQRVSDEQLRAVENVRRAFETRLPVLTGGRSVAQAFLGSKPLGSGNTPVLGAPTLNAGSQANVASALTWLQNHQGAEGAWRDHPLTAVRDTAVAVEALRDLQSSGSPSVNLALGWLGAQPLGNTDYLARRTTLLGTQGTDDSWLKLSADQNADGGWGVANGYASSPLDTALAFMAVQSDPDPVRQAQARDKAKAYLLSRQNADGGWSHAAGGVSRTATTAAVVRSLGGYAGDSAVRPSLQRASGFLAGRQNTDGGFGDSPSTTHDTANVLWSLAQSGQLGAVRAGDGFSFLNATQKADGSWDGSVYATSLAVRTLGAAQAYNWVLSQIQAQPTTVRDGQRVGLTINIQNAGTVAAPGGVVRIYDGDPAAGRALLDIPVPPLASGSYVSVSGSWRTLNAPGNHQLHAVIDPDTVGAEITRVDNVGTVRVAVSSVPDQAELTVAAADLLVTPAVIDRLPTTVGVVAQVSNLGLTDATNVRVRLLLRDGAPGSDRVIDERAVNLLGRTSVPVSLSGVISKAGRQVLTVVVDPDNAVADFDRGNNSASVEVNTTATYDLSVTQSDLVVPASNVSLGSDIALKATVHNKGTVATPPFMAVFAVTDGATTRELQRQSMQLDAGGASTFTLPWRVDLPGNLQFVVKLDPEGTVADVDRSDNEARANFNASSVSGPNIVVSYRDIVATPDPAREGSPLMLSAVIRNIGNQPAVNVQYGFFEGDPQASGQLLGELKAPIALIQPGEAVTVSLTLPALKGTSDRLYFAGAEPEQDTDPDDNYAFRVVSVKGLPDLAVSNAALQISPASPKPGDHVDITARISNLGQLPSAPVTVRLLDATDNSVVGTQVLPEVPPQATVSLAFGLDLGSQASARVLTIEVDPENTLVEADETNNVAQFAFTTQDGNAYLSEPFFSPNGDGVKDVTTFGFRLPPGSAEVRAVDADGKTVRHFSGAFTAGMTASSVLWDGRDDAGQVAVDGSYRLQVASASGQVLVEARAVLDTNHTPILRASGTPYEFYRNLSCGMKDFADFTSTLDEQTMFFSVPPVSDSAYSQGIFKVAVQGGEISTVVGPTFYASENGNGLNSVSASARGEQLAFIKGTWNGDELWTVTGEGGNLRRLLSVAAPANGEAFDYLPWSAIAQDASAVLVHGTMSSSQVGYGVSVLRRIPVSAIVPEGPALFDGRQGQFEGITQIYMSPNRRRAVLMVTNRESGQHEYVVIDLETGLITRSPEEVYRRFQGGYYSRNRVKWAPDSSRFVLMSRLVDNGLDQENQVDFRIESFDSSFQSLHRFDTNAPGDKTAWYGGNIDDLDWASNSAEFVFSHDVDCYSCNQGFTDGSTVVTPPSPSTLQKKIGYHVDLKTSAVKLLDNKWWFNDIILWAPSDRRLVKSGGWPDSEYQSVNVDTGGVANLFPAIPRFLDSTSPAYATAVNFSASGRRLNFTSQDRTNLNASACGDASQYLFAYESLQNLVADLQPLRDSRLGGIVLKGTASDANLVNHKLEYADQKTPNDWHAITPGGTEPKLGASMANWVPPSYGTFLVRLTVNDKAGNTAQVVRRVRWSDTPAITDLVKNLDYISPNGDGVQDALQLSYRVLEPVHLAFEIVDAEGLRRRLVERDHAHAGTSFQFEWDGRDDNGRMVPDGKYTLKVLDYEFPFQLDNTPPVLDVSYPNHGFTLAANEAHPEVGPWLEKPEVTMQAKATDALLDSLQVLTGEGVAPGAWVAPQEGVVLSEIVVNDKGLPQGNAEYVVNYTDYPSRRVQVVARDKAGNVSYKTTSLGQEDLLLGEFDGYFWAVPSAAIPEDAKSWLVPRREQRVTVAGASFTQDVLRAMFAPPPSFKGEAKRYFDDFVKQHGLLRGFHFTYEDTLRGNVLRAEFQYVFLPSDPETGAMPTVPTIEQATHLPWIKEAVIGAVDGERLSTVSQVQATLHTLNFNWVLPSQDSGMWLWRSVYYMADGNVVRSSVHHQEVAKLSESISVLWKAFHVPAASCGEAPTETAKISVAGQLLPGMDSVEVGDPGDINELILQRVKADGTVEELNRVVLPKVEKGRKRDFFPWTPSFSTADWPVGQHDFRLLAKVNGDWQTVGTPSLQVSHTAPVLNIVAPLDGAKMCPQHTSNKLKQKTPYLSLERTIETRDTVYPDVEMGLLSSGGQWTVGAPVGLPNAINDQPVTTRGTGDSCIFDIGNQCRDSGHLQWSNITSKVEKDFQVPYWNRAGLAVLPSSEKIILQSSANPAGVHGLLSLRARAYGPSGHLACSPVMTVEVDGRVDGGADIDRTLFSPNEDGTLDDVTMTVTALEPLNVTVDVLPIMGDNAGELILGSSPVAVLAKDVYVADGRSVHAWNGRASNNAVVADGRYALRATLVDGCGNEKVVVHAVEVDNTPPVIAVSTPKANASIGMELLIKGAVSDAHPSSFDVNYTMLSSPEALIRLPSLASGGATKGIVDLARWIVGNGTQGDANIVIRAYDQAGNSTIASVPVTLLPPTDIINSLSVSVDPLSPNGDGRRETTSILYNLSQAAKVTLALTRKDGGAPIKTLLNNVSAPAGNNAVVWDGKRTDAQVEADGDIVLTLTAEVDNGTLVARQQTQASLILDKTPPVIVVSSPNTPVSTGAAGLSARAQDPLLTEATLSVSSGNGSWRDVAITNDLSGVLKASIDDEPEGPLDVRVRATDAADNISERNVHVEIDRTPPKPVIVTPAPAAYISGLKGPYAITGSIEEKHLSRYELLLAQGAPPATGQPALLASGAQVPQSPLLLSWKLDGVQDGPYLMSLDAVDAAGLHAVAAVPVTIDSTPPTALIKSTGSPMFVKLGTEIHGTASDQNFASYRLEIAPGAAGSTTRWSPVSEQQTAVTDAVLFKPSVLPVDGVYAFRLTVTDLAGNEASTVQEVVVDTTAPAAPLTLKAQIKDRRNADLNWTASTDADVVGYALYRNGARIGTGLVEALTYLDVGLPAGSYTYVVRAIDRAGNESSSSNQAIVTVTLSEPVAQIFVPTRDGYAAGIVDVRGTAAAPSDFKEYRLFIGAGKTPTSWQLLRRSPQPLTADSLAAWNTLALPEGAVYSIKLEAEDLSGAVATDVTTVVVRNVPPRAPLNLAAVATGANVALTWTGSSDPEIAGYLLYRDQQLVTASGLTIGSLLPYAIKPTAYADLNAPDGVHHYVVHAIDKAGNVSDPSNEVEVSIDTRPPHVVIVKPLTGTKVDKVATVVGESPDTDIASVRYQYQRKGGDAWVDITPVLTTAPWTIVWSFDGLPYDIYLVRAVATDQGGKTDPAPSSIELNLTDLRPPEAVTNLKARAKGANVVLDWSASAGPNLGGYLIDRTSEFNGSPQRLTAAPVQGTTYTDVSLADAQYTYIVTAVSTTQVESKPSMPADARVYTPTFTQPYTPTSAEVSALTGHTLGGAHVSVQLGNGTPVAETEADEAGLFNLAAVTLPLGDNRWFIETSDSLGNISKRAAFHVLRGTAPAQPTGLVATVAGSASLKWAANIESNLAGYVPAQAGQFKSINATGATASASSYYKYYYCCSYDQPPSKAIDGSLTTAWAPQYTYVFPTDHWLQLSYSSAQLLTGASIRFLASETPPQKFSIEGYDGEVWVPLATFDKNALWSIDHRFTRPYLTNRARLVIPQAANGVLPQVAELSFQRASTTTSLTYNYGTFADGYVSLGVSAYNTLGLTSALSETQAAVGDVVGPIASVLSTAVSGSDVTLNWTASSSADIKSYVLARDGIDIATVLATAPRSYVDRQRPNGHYIYTVRGVDTKSNAGPLSNQAPADVNVTGSFATLEAYASVPDVGGMVAVGWFNNGPGSMPASFTLKRATQPGGPYETLVSRYFDYFYVDKAVQNDVRYYYSVSGYDGAGNAASVAEEVSGMPRDIQAPDAPVFISPGLAPGPVNVTRSSTDIALYAEPGASVLVTQDGNELARVVTRRQDESHDLSATGQMQISADGRMVYASQDIPRVRLAVDGSGVKSDALFDKDSSGAEQFRFHPDSRFALFSAFDEGTRRHGLYRWDSSNDTATLWRDMNAINFGISPDGKTVFAAGTDLATNAAGFWLIDWHTADTTFIDVPDWGNIQSMPLWSPDSKKVAYEFWGSGGSTQLYVFDVESKQSRAYPVQGDITGGAWSWTPDSASILVETMGNFSHRRIQKVTMDGAEPSVLVDTGGNGYGLPSVSPDGLSYIALDYDREVLVRRSWNGEESVVGTPIADYYYATLPVWSRTGRVVYGTDWRRSRVTDMRGYVTVPDVGLQAGVNVFAAYAFDEKLNRSQSAAPLSVNLMIDSLPDWAVSPSDWLVLPSTPRIGETTDVAVAVHNLGADGTPVPVVLSVKDESGREVALLTEQLPAMGKGDIHNLHVRWTPDAAGRYTLKVVVDGMRSQLDGNGANNTSTFSFDVSQGQQVDLRVIPDAVHYPSDSVANAVVRVVNAGETVSGQLNVQVLDGSGFVVSDLGTHEVGNLAYGKTISEAFQWAVGKTLAAPYQLVATLRSAAGDMLATGRANVQVDAASALTAFASTDHAQYLPGEAVAARGTVQYGLGNANLEATQARLSLIADDGHEVASRTVDLTGMASGTEAQVDVTWVATQAGVYGVRLVVGDAAMPRAQAVSSFVVGTPEQPILSGKLQLSSDIVAVNERLIGGVTIRNSGAQVLGMQVRVRVLNLVTGAELASWSGSVDVLQGGAPALAQALLTAAPWPLGFVDVRLEAQIAGQWQMLDHLRVQVADQTPPTIGFISPAPGTIMRSDAGRVVISAAASLAPVSTVQLSADLGVRWSNVAPQDTRLGLYSAAALPAADGPVTFAARAEDGLGNKSGVVQLSVVIDNTAPAIAISGVTDGQSSRLELAPTVSVTDVNLQSSLVLLDNVPFASGAAVGEGAHVLSVSALDKAGNKADRTVRFTIDRTAPVVTVMAPVSGLVWKTMPDVQARAVDALTGVASVEVLSATGSWLPMNATADAVYGKALADATDGSYLLAVRATDMVGNTSASSEFRVIIDKTPPVITVSGVADKQLSLTNLTPVVQVSDSNLESSSIQLDGVNFVSGTAVGEGAHTLSASARDKAGNTSAVTLTFTVDRTAPVVTLLAPNTGLVTRQMPQVQMRAVDTLSGVASAELRQFDGSWTGLTDATNGIYQGTPVDAVDGIYELAVRASDLAGNVSAPLPVTVVVDKSAPVITVTGVSVGAVYRTAVTPVVTVADANPGTLTLTLDGQPFVSGQSVSATGSHTLVAEAVDQAGNTASTSVPFQIAPLVLTGTVTASPTSAAAGASVAIDARATNGSITTVNDVQMTVTLRDRASGNVLQTYSDSTNLAVGGNYQRSWNWIAAGAAGAFIDVTWTALAEGKTVVLATSQVQIAAPSVAVDLTPALGSWGNLLVYMRCIRSEDEVWGACGTSNRTFSNSTTVSNCDSDRKTWLTQYLAAQGVRATIVTDSVNFVKQLRTGLYSGYWISGGGLKLSPMAAGEVMAAVRRGDTLMLEGWGDGHNHLLWPMAGVKYLGKMTGSTATMTTAGELFPASTLTVTAPVLLLETSGHDQAAMGNYSGIVSNTYGLGRTMTFGFDLISTLRTGAASATWNNIFQSTRQYLTRVDSTDAVANGVISLRSSVKNNGASALTLNYVAKIPAASKLLQSSPTVTSSTVEGGLPTLTWRLNAPASASMMVDAAMRAPMVEGDYLLSTFVNQVNANGSFTLLQSKQTSLHVSSAATLTGVAIAKAQALDASCLSTAAKLAALKWLTLANMAVAASDWDDALRYLVTAHYALMWAQGNGTDEAKLAVARAVEAVERRL